MSGKQAFDRKLEQIRALRTEEAPAAMAQLRRALEDRSNMVVSKAASIIEERMFVELVPDLLKSYHRHFESAIRNDPQCWAKNAISKALLALEFEGPEPYIRGLRFVQMEPSFGGRTDSAVTLRATCAIALASCSRLPAFEVLELLIDSLTDAAVPVRVEAARAIAMLGKAEGALLLRLKVRTGDAEARVVGACFSSIVHLQRSAGVEFVAGYLRAEDDDLRLEAAAALGETRDPAAFVALKNCYESTTDQRFQGALLVSMGASRQQEAIEFLIRLIDPGSTELAARAIAALAPNRFHEETRERIEAAVRATGSELLLASYEQHFPGSSATCASR